MNIRSIVLIGIILLVGCSGQNELPTPSTWQSYKSELIQLSYPHEAKYRLDRDNGSVALATNSGSSFSDKTTDYFISINNLTLSQLPDYFGTSCDDSVKESVVIEKSSDTYTLSGKFPGYPCAVDKCDDTKYGMTQYKGRYVLCSEHKGKTVVVEINEITDDPVLAKAIFSTFRWLK